MNTKKYKLASIFTVVLTAIGILFVCWPTGVLARSVLPEEVVVSDTFYPGYGSPIGKVQRVKGEVVAVHSHAAEQGFRLRPGMKLYKGDTLFTMKKGKVRFRMNDGSILSMASETKLVLTKSVYNKKKKSRSSFLNMAIGKTRLLVVKLINFKRSEFKVKTPTAVCGVRGSDYVIEASEQVSVFIALEATTIEVNNPQFPDVEPVVLNEYEMSKVYVDGYPSEPIRLTPEEIKRVKEQFISVDPNKSEPEAGELQADKGTEKGVKTVSTSDVRVLVPEDVIVKMPDDFEVGDPEKDDIGKTVRQSGITEERSIISQTTLIEQFNEDDGWPDGFPGSPD